MNIPNSAPATGPPAVRQRRAGIGGGVPAERIPRGKPPNVARRGEIATKTQELRPELTEEVQEIFCECRNRFCACGKRIEEKKNRDRLPALMSSSSGNASALQIAQKKHNVTGVRAEEESQSRSLYLVLEITGNEVLMHPGCKSTPFLVWLCVFRFSSLAPIREQPGREIKIHQLPILG
jgi:hypothetical protein